MIDNDWKRARSSEQIKKRINDILDAAGKVFQNMPYENVTMLMIAEEAASSRSNLYRYFKSREEIFMSLFLYDLETWVNQLKSEFTKEVGLEVFTKRWTDVLCRQTRLLELSPLFSLSLEKNTSEEVLRKTKLAVHEKMKEVVPFILTAVPALTSPQVVDFFLTHQALLAGAWPMGQYDEMQRRVVEDLALPQGAFNFATFYEKTILIYLRGLTLSK